MRRLIFAVMTAVMALSLLFSTGCPKKAVKDTPEGGEQQQSGDPGPKPPPLDR